MNEVSAIAGRGRGVRGGGFAAPVTLHPCATCPARKVGFCGQLDDRTLDQMAERSLRVSLPAGSPVRTPDAESPPSIVLKGVLRSVHSAADGSRQVLCLTLPGEIAAGGTGSDATVLEAATDVQLCRLHPESYRRTLRERAPLRRALVAQARIRVDRLRNLSLALIGLTIEDRLTAFLAEAAGFMPWQPLPGGGGILTVTLDRGDIADLLATSAESISRITHRLERNGLLRIRDPRHFEIPDLARLSPVGAIGMVMPQPGAVPQGRGSVQSGRMTVVDETGRHELYSSVA